MSAFDAFAQKWLPPLKRELQIVFEHAPLSVTAGTHVAVADAFVAQLGFTPIGFNWELLDTSPNNGGLPHAVGSRSALLQITQALEQDITNPSRPSLPHEQASACARDFMGLFDGTQRTFVSNRYDGLWNPISGASVEWGFVGFDDQAIALLLLSAAD